MKSTLGEDISRINASNLCDRFALIMDVKTQLTESRDSSGSVEVGALILGFGSKGHYEATDRCKHPCALLFASIANCSRHHACSWYAYKSPYASLSELIQRLAMVGQQNAMSIGHDPPV